MKHFLPFVILFAAFLGSEGNAEDADTYYLLPNKSFALKGLGANQFLAGSNVKVLTPGDRSGSAWVIEIDGGQFNIDQLANMGLSLEAIATKKEVEPKNTRPFTEVDLRSAIMFAYGDDGYYVSVRPPFAH